MTAGAEREGSGPERPRAADLGWLLSTMAAVPDGDAWLSPHERAALERLVRPDRRAAFRLRRYAAKLAVARWIGADEEAFQLASFDVTTDGEAAPRVRHNDVPTDVRLSLSHRLGLALAAVGPAGLPLGCNLELAEPRDDAFLAALFRPDERADVRSAPELERDARAALYWSAKQSALGAAGYGDPSHACEVAISLGGACVSHGWARFDAVSPGGLELDGYWRRLGQAVLTLAVAGSAEPRALVR